VTSAVPGELRLIFVAGGRAAVDSKRRSTGSAHGRAGRCAAGPQVSLCAIFTMTASWRVVFRPLCPVNASVFLPGVAAWRSTATAFGPGDSRGLT